MAKSPSKPKAPQLIDAPDAPEIFVSEIVGVGVIGSCVSINLASHRWTISEQGQGSDPEFSRVIVGRLVLSGDAALQLAQHLARLSEQSRKAKEEAAAAK